MPELSNTLFDFDHTRRMEVSLPNAIVCDVSAVITCFTLEKGVTKSGYKLSNKLNGTIQGLTQLFDK